MSPGVDKVVPPNQVLESLDARIGAVALAGGRIVVSKFYPQKKIYPLSTSKLSVTVIIQFPFIGHPAKVVLKF